MDASTVGLIGAFGGAGLTYLGTKKISKDERADAACGEKQRAFGAYLGALFPVVAELREMPPERPKTVLDKGFDKMRGEAGRWVANKKAVAALGGRPLMLMDRLSFAIAQVKVLDLPVGVVAAFDEANDYVERLAAGRTDALRAEWPSVRKHLDVAADLLKR